MENEGEDSGEEEGERKEARGVLRESWLFAEGWRAELRGAGDVVERERGRWLFG